MNKLIHLATNACLFQMRDSVTYINTIKEWVNRDGVRMYCIWIGPFPVVGVTHPETIKQVMKQENSKAKGQVDGYRYIKPWIGKTIFCFRGLVLQTNLTTTLKDVLSLFSGIVYEVYMKIAQLLTG